MFNGLSLLIVFIMTAIIAVIFYHWGKQDADPITYDEGWHDGYHSAVNDAVYMDGKIPMDEWRKIASDFWNEQE